MIFLNKNKKKHEFWPVYIKNPVNDLSSYALIPILMNRLIDTKVKFQVDRIVELTSYNYCPHTKVYLNHNSYNTGAETHFFFYEGSVVGSLVIGIARDQISNWRCELIQARVIAYLKEAFNPLELTYNHDPYLFKDNYSLKAGFSLCMEVEGEDFRLFVVNIYLDISHDVGNILYKL